MYRVAIGLGALAILAAPARAQSWGTQRAQTEGDWTIAYQVAQGVGRACGALNLAEPGNQRVTVRQRLALVPGDSRRAQIELSSPAWIPNTDPSWAVTIEAGGVSGSLTLRKSASGTFATDMSAANGALADAILAAPTTYTLAGGTRFSTPPPGPAFTPLLQACLAWLGS